MYLLWKPCWANILLIVQYLYPDFWAVYAWNQSLIHCGQHLSVLEKKIWYYLYFTTYNNVKLLHIGHSLQTFCTPQIITLCCLIRSIYATNLTIYYSAFNNNCRICCMLSIILNYAIHLHVESQNLQYLRRLRIWQSIIAVHVLYK